MKKRWPTIAKPARGVRRVEDNLASQNLLASQHDAEVDALQAAQKQRKIANNRLSRRPGHVSRGGNAEITALDIERTTVQLRGEQLSPQ